MFDSGVGGLTVMRQFKKLLPDENILFFADTAHVPIGDRSREELELFVRQILDFMQQEGIKAAIFACNTTSALVLSRVKEDYPFPMVGTIRAGVKEALRRTKNRKIGVICTNNTAKSHAFASFVQMEDVRYQTYELGCPKLVPLIEAGQTEGPEVEAAVSEYVEALREKDADTLILGCTHYPFLAKVIAEKAGADMQIVDPAVETAREMADLLREKDLLNGSGQPGEIRYYASGDPESFRKNLAALLPEYAGEVKQQRFDEA